jgi:hypothetical protein
MIVAAAFASPYRNPKPRAMIPRSTSVVPPWMDGELRHDNRGVRQQLIEAGAIVSVAVDECSEIAGLVRQPLLPQSAQVFHNGSLEHRILPGLKHPVHRNRHAPQRMQLRHQAADAFSGPRIRCASQDSDQFK